MAPPARQSAGRARIDHPVRQVAELHASRPALGTYRYGLQGTATHWALSEALTELEPGAAGTALYSSGLAAITTALLAVLDRATNCSSPTASIGRHANSATRSSSASAWRPAITTR